MRLLIGMMLAACLLWGDHDDDHHHIPKDLSFLDLNEVQYPQVKAALYEYRHDLKAFRHEKKIHRRDSEALFLGDTFDIREFENAHLALEKKAVTIQSAFLKKLHGILTPGQRKLFLRHFDEWDVE